MPESQSAQIFLRRRYAEVFALIAWRAIDDEVPLPRFDGDATSRWFDLWHQLAYAQRFVSPEFGNEDLNRMGEWWHKSMTAPDLVREFTITDIRRWFHFMFRCYRWSGGCVHESMRSGTLQAVLRRLQQLAPSLVVAE